MAQRTQYSLNAFRHLFWALCVSAAFHGVLLSWLDRIFTQLPVECPTPCNQQFLDVQLRHPAPIEAPQKTVAQQPDLYDKEFPAQPDSQKSAQQETETRVIRQPAPEITPTAPSSTPLGPWYYTSRYLHRRPTPLKPIEPSYPKNAQTIAGKVVLLLFISDGGTVDRFEVVESTPKGVFEDSAVEAFTNARYAPGLITGYPVRSQLLLEITYDPGLVPQTTLLLSVENE